MKWISFLLVLLIMQGCGSTAKTPVYQPPAIITGSELIVEPVKFIAGNFTDFDVDALGNIYLLRPAGTLVKYSAAGDSIGVYNDIKTLGQPTSMDVRNPFKMLLFYKPYTSISVLDKYLRELQLVNLRTINTFRVQTAAISYDNNIWIFDEENGRLKKLNEQLQTVTESPDLRQLQHDIPSVDKIIDHNNFVYVYDAAMGLFVFDYYGALKNVYPIRGLSNLHANGNSLYAFRENAFIELEPETFKEIPVDLNLPPGKIIFSGDHVYRLSTTGLQVYARV